MAGRKYLHKAIFNSDPLRFDPEKNSGKGPGLIGALHKTEWSLSPFCATNEYVAGCLAQAIRLPVPAFAITRHELLQTHIFSSLDFNFDGLSLPPIEPDICWQRLPWLCTGVLLFDILIANEDRHDENLAADNTLEPSAIQVFDHDQSLFGGGGNFKGLARLLELEDRLGITGPGTTGGNRHVFLDEADSAAHFVDWYLRIRSIPDWFIDDICKTPLSPGLGKPEMEGLARFLKKRRETLHWLVEAFQNEFTKITDFEGVTEWKPPRSLF